MPETEEVAAAPKFGFVAPEADEANLIVREEMAINVEPGEITIYWACLVTFDEYRKGWVEQTLISS